MADNVYQLAGKVNIPTEKKSELNKCILEIMDKCGIRKTIEMEVAGVTVMAVSPAQPDENGIVTFDYSVFEKQKRDISTYDINTCELYVKDGGYQEFEIVMNMIMVLLETYTNGGCYFVKSGKLCDAGGYLAVLQGVLGKKITLPGRTRMWEMYLFFRNSEEYQSIAYRDLWNDYSLIYGELDMEQLLAVFEVDRNELTFPEKEHISCRDEINTSNQCSREEYAYRIFCSMDEDEKSTMKEFLTELLNSEFDRRKKLSLRQDKKGIIAELSLYVLPSCLTLAYAKAVEKDFWEIWDSFGTPGYTDIIQKNEPEKTETDFRKLPFYRAIQRKDEDEFLEFWDGSNLILSQNMKKCVQEWQERFRGICIPSRFSMEHLLANVMDRLEKGYCRYLDKAFVTEFIEHGNDSNYQKALILLEQLLDAGQEYFPELTGNQAEEWIIRDSRSRFERTAISAFASLMINKKQRRLMFGF